MNQLTQRTRRRNYPHGAAIDRCQIMVDADDDAIPKTSLSNTNDDGSFQISDLFVTMCFFARLGFVQPPSCLKCAYHSSRCSIGVSVQKNCNHDNAEKEDVGGRSDDGGGNGSTESGTSTRGNPSTPSLCAELVAWRVDANIALHPDNLEGNIVFVTCDTAKSLVNGDAYPSIRWDVRNKRLLFEKIYRDIR